MPPVNEVVSLSVDDGIATLTVDSPPVNALSAKVRKGLDLGVRQALADRDVRGIVILCAGRTFFAGADITEFDKTPEEPSFQALQAVIENAAKPILAAIHGNALGGGLEVALACHYRIATPSAKLGLPEVNLGLLPGAGGTQRLPRVVGVEAALEMIALGAPVGAAQAQRMGLIDALAEEGALHESAVAFLRQAIRDKQPLRRVCDDDSKLADGRSNPKMFDEFRTRHAKAFRGFKAPENIIRAIEAATALPFEQGMAREAELFGELLRSRESAAQRYLFFAERKVAKIPDIPADTPTQPVRSVGIIGAGTMGGGIAMNFLNVGIPVTIAEQKPEALERGVALIRRNYETTVRKGRLSEAALEQRMALLTPTLDYTALGKADLIIEAVYEDMDLKRQVFARLDQAAAPHAILASNTSFLDLDAIAAATSRPERVVGMHFFSPANVMRLLEVVRGEKTAKDVVATAMRIGREIGKIAILSRVCDGFIANRMMAPRSKVANELILEGPMPWDVDRVMVDFGFPMGPFAMTDLVGLDVIGWNPETTSSSSVLEVLCEMGRWGQKKNGGFYDYDERRMAAPSAVAEKVILDFSTKHGIQRRAFTDQEIIERLLFPVVNEGTKLLEEGIALRASDVDVA
ncbi:MAG: 3-hydroxyacyl-CoA dehydrogenase NAD-binding domain-containing protein, partial [Caulobacterales bacterium]